MREIKFRAWNPSAGEMFEDRVVKRFGFDMSNWIYMQYTGLKDKNGKEIYEGDVLSKPDRKGELMCGVVEWYQPRCAFRWYHEFKTGGAIGCSLTDHLQPKGQTFEDYEAIGNIYENPELLEPKP